MTSFVDVFGRMIGETLLGESRLQRKLTDQRKCIEDGAAPMPLYTCLNVKEDRSALLFR